MLASIGIIQGAFEKQYKTIIQLAMDVTNL